MDMMSTMHQMIKNGYTVADMEAMALYELEMFVIVAVATNERKANEET